MAGYTFCNLVLYQVHTTFLGLVMPLKDIIKVLPLRILSRETCELPRLLLFDVIQCLPMLKPCKIWWHFFCRFHSIILHRFLVIFFPLTGQFCYLWWNWFLMNPNTKQDLLPICWLYRHICIDCINPITLSMLQEIEILVWKYASLQSIKNHAWMPFWN